MSLPQLIRTNLMLVILLGLTACASMQPDTDEQTVIKRVKAHQQALLENDLEKAYEFLSPGYRKTHTYKDYLGTKGSTVKRISSEIDKVECDEDACSVFIVLYYKYQGIAGFHTKPEDPPVSRINKERWIKVDGTWWMYRGD